MTISIEKAYLGGGGDDLIHTTMADSQENDQPTNKEQINSSISKAKRGRPLGSNKYKDSMGNPINVMEWRKLNKGWRTKYHPEYKDRDSVKVEDLLTLICQSTGKKRNQVLRESLEAYVRLNLK